MSRGGERRNATGQRCLRQDADAMTRNNDTSNHSVQLRQHMSQ